VVSLADCLDFEAGSRPPFRFASLEAAGSSELAELAGCGGCAEVGVALKFGTGGGAIGGIAEGCWPPWGGLVVGVVLSS
jgi:hypothetical protein